MKKGKHIFLPLVILFVVGFICFGQNVSATQKIMEDVKEKIGELEDSKENTKNQLNELEQQKDILEEDASKLDSQLANLAASLTTLEEKLIRQEKSISKNQKALEAAKKKEQQQYENMKLRIQFMYENGDSSLLEVLLGAGSFAEIINMSEYITSIHEYDREMLLEYQNTKEDIAQKEVKLEQKKADLLTLKEQQEEQKSQVETLLAQASMNISETNEKINQTQEKMDAYEAEIKKKKAYEEELEAQKAAEDAKRLEEIKKQEEELKRQAEENRHKEEENNKKGEANKTPPVINNSKGDADLLAALIQCEAEGESYEGKLAVGSVVINRVRSSYFPNTVVEVIYQSGQFSPVASGRFAAVLGRGANSECKAAAAAVLSGKVTVNSLYFKKNIGSISGLVIGSHVFY